MIDGKNFFDQQINWDLKTYETQKNCYWSGRLLHDWMFVYSYFKDYYKMIALDLSKQQVPDADPRAIVIQQINFTANIDTVGNTKIFFIIEKAKETVFDFPQGTAKVL